MTAKNPIFAVFGLRHLVISPIGINIRKFEHGYTTTNLPLSSGIKIVSVLPRFHGEIERKSPTFKSVTNKKTNKQKDSTFLAAAAASEIRTPPNLAW